MVHIWEERGEIFLHPPRLFKFQKSAIQDLFLLMKCFLWSVIESKSTCVVWEWHGPSDCSNRRPKIANAS